MDAIATTTPPWNHNNHKTKCWTTRKHAPRALAHFNHVVQNNQSPTSRSSTEHAHHNSKLTSTNKHVFAMTGASWQKHRLQDFNQQNQKPTIIDSNKFYHRRHQFQMTTDVKTKQSSPNIVTSIFMRHLQMKPYTPNVLSKVTRQMSNSLNLTIPRLKCDACAMFIATTKMSTLNNDEQNGRVEIRKHQL